MPERLRLVFASLLIVAAATAVGLAPTSANSPPTADLDGRAISLDRVGNYYCHDFDAPRIHCFRTEAVLERSVSSFLSNSLGALALEAATATNYVKIYDYTYYAGLTMYVSQSYPLLSSIGWDNRISSYIAINGGAGYFYLNTYYSGQYFTFCCGDRSAALNGTFNNTISSLERN